MIGLVILGLSRPVGKYPDACDEADMQYDGYFDAYGGGCKFLATTNPQSDWMKAYCRGGFMCDDGDYGRCSDGRGMKYPNDFIAIMKPDAGDCTGKDCPLFGRFEGNFFVKNMDYRPFWGMKEEWDSPDKVKGWCGVEFGSSYGMVRNGGDWDIGEGVNDDAPAAYNFARVSSSYADARFNFSTSQDWLSFSGPYSEFIRFGCDDDAESSFNDSASFWNKPDDKTIYYPLAEEHKCKKGGRTYYYKYDKDDGEYYRLEESLTDFWGTVKKTIEERNGIRHYKVKVGLSNKLSVAAGIGIAVAVSAVIVAIGCLIFYLVCKSKVAVKS